VFLFIFNFKFSILLSLDKTDMGCNVTTDANCSISCSNQECQNAYFDVSDSSSFDLTCNSGNDSSYACRYSTVLCPGLYFVLL
jgi:hypothetical protein